MSNGLDFNAVQALAINPNTLATLYGGHMMGSTVPQTVVKTGAWSVMGKPFIFYAATGDGGVFKSVNCENWTALDGGLPARMSLPLTRLLHQRSTQDHSMTVFSKV